MAETLANIPSNRGILLVEGVDDKHLLWQICRRQEVLFLVERAGGDLSVTLRTQATSFHILDIGSRSELLQSVRTTVDGSERPAVGIVVDADANLENCWNDVVNSFDRTGIRLPPTPEPTGTIIPENGFSPRIGIWLMPDNESNGELEDFALGMLPANDTVWQSSVSYIDGIPHRERKFEPDKTDKAKLHAWLATRREPGRMGAAVGAGDLEIEGSLCQNFLSWLTRLFV